MTYELPPLPKKDATIATAGYPRKREPVWKEASVRAYGIQCVADRMSAALARIAQAEKDLKAVGVDNDHPMEGVAGGAVLELLFDIKKLLQP